MILTPFIITPFCQHYKEIWHHRTGLLVLGGLGMGVCGAFVYIGANSTSAVNIGVIYSASPVFILLIARFFYQKPIAAPAMIGIIMALFGVLWVISKGQLQALLSIDFVAGDLWILGAAIGWAFYSIWSGQWQIALPATLKLGAVIAGGVIILFPFMLAEGVSIGWPQFNLNTMLLVLFLSLVASLGAYKLYLYLIHALGAAVAGLTLYLTPITAGLMGFLLLGEPMELYHFVSLAMVLGGIALSNIKPRKPALLATKL